MRDKDLRKALLMGVDFSMTGRNKVVQRPFPAFGLPARKATSEPKFAILGLWIPASLPE